ncbi:ATP-binding cassette sub-family A member 13-like [Molossus nigricans]
MGPAGRQLGALLWKNWLCRRRHRVLFLAEFVWPCTLFMILTVLRFQEPPRHRDHCYLQPRDLPSAGVFPFVRGLLCNTGARCRNTSYAESPGHGFRFQARAGHHTINDLVFLQEMQDLADEICELMDKATDLKKVWVERSKTPGKFFSWLWFSNRKYRNASSKNATDAGSVSGEAHARGAGCRALGPGEQVQGAWRWRPRPAASGLPTSPLPGVPPTRSRYSVRWGLGVATVGPFPQDSPEPQEGGRSPPPTGPERGLHISGQREAGAARARLP